MFHYWIKNHRVFNCLMKTSIKELHPQMGPFQDKNMLCSMCIVLWNLYQNIFSYPCLFRRTWEQRLYEGLQKSGVLTSPNFPSNYPNNLHNGKTIEGAKGDIVNIHFTDVVLNIKLTLLTLLMATAHCWVISKGMISEGIQVKQFEVFTWYSNYIYGTFAKVSKKQVACSCIDLNVLCNRVITKLRDCT